MTPTSTADLYAATIGVRIEIRTGLACVVARATYQVLRLFHEPLALRAARRVAYRLARFRIEGGPWQRFSDELASDRIPPARAVRR